MQQQGHERRSILQRLIFFRQERSERRSMSLGQAIKKNPQIAVQILLHGHASLPHTEILSNDVSTVVTIP